MQVHNKRQFLLLEVLIAFTIITLCMIPLMMPHFGMIKAQREFINKIKINHFANLSHVNILEKLHKNEILLSSIEAKQIFPIDEGLLKEIRGYHATYQFTNEKHKKRNTNGFTTHKVILEVKFVPNKVGKTFIYKFPLAFGSKKEPEPDPAKDEEDDEDEE